jgi:hypothetical protein
MTAQSINTSADSRRRMVAAHRPSVRLVAVAAPCALDFALRGLRFGLLRVGLHLGRLPRRCAGRFRLRLDPDIDVSGLALRLQRLQVIDRARGRLVCGHTGVGQAGRLHEVVQRQGKTPRHRAIEANVDGERRRHAIGVSFQRSTHARPPALPRVRSEASEQFSNRARSFAS